MSEEKISEEALERYVNTDVRNHIIDLDGMRYGELEWGLPQVIDAKFQPVVLLPLEYKPVREKFPWVEGITPEQAGKIADTFNESIRRLPAVLQGHAVNGIREIPTKAEVAKAFSDVHEMLAPTTEGNHYMRSLIERAMEVLELDMSQLASRSSAQFEQIERKLSREEPTTGMGHGNY